MSHFGIRFAAFGLTLATVVIGVVLVELGLPVPVAAALALLFVGIAVGALERRLAREAPVFGLAMLSLSGLSGMVAAITALPQVNSWVVGCATVLVEVGVLIGAVLLYQRTLLAAGVLARRRMAGRRGWRYEPEAIVPVPGSATGASGRDVVHATANGLAVTVFDHADARGRRTRTVWLVHLPPAPPDAMAAFARGLPTQAAAWRLPPGSWLDGSCLCLARVDGGRGAKAAVVEGYVDSLSRFAAAFSWPRTPSPARRTVAQRH
jgi:hypothetical protein